MLVGYILREMIVEEDSLVLCGCGNPGIWRLQKKDQRIIITAKKCYNSKNDLRTNRKTGNIELTKQKLGEKQIQGYFRRQTKELAYEVIWSGQRRRNIKREKLNRY